MGMWGESQEDGEVAGRDGESRCTMSKNRLDGRNGAVQGAGAGWRG
jgi:hypothetical protein